MFLNVDVNPSILHYLIKKRVKVPPYEDILERTKETGRWLMLAAEKQQTMLSEV
jgi:hypothetical protein